MNRHLQALYDIGRKPERRIVGLMSGTSLDGLDVALCRVSGQGQQTQVRLEKFRTVAYSDAIKAEVRTVFARQTVDFQQLTLLNGWIGRLHGQMVLDCLQSWGVAPGDVDLIASHGQTVMHAPLSLHGKQQFGNATLQIGDGDHVAVTTGILTISDFRQKHIAAGGEGAPLAIYGDYFLFGRKGENRLLLNMGGIANFTYLPASMAPDDVLVTDTGTGNTLIDACTRMHFPSMAFDKDAALASQGQVNVALLHALKAHAFFDQPLPKSTGPELFNLDYLETAQRKSDTLTLSPQDLLATLTRFSAETIAQAVSRCAATVGLPIQTLCIYMSGGGMHNPLLTQWLRDLLPCTFERTDALGIPGDAKEAVLFAILANETVAGSAADFGARRGTPSVAMGKICFPA